ncbi:MAG: hypothetical protein A3I61_09170 [Acidobacteria bacterium RIFCSPLOWO2_02_FULL_68_18]|nr:MAG: hypothetical protein A3I61_09170 [Acidobacteria bacterium RIFCSPLOWO2_02_FULL_68_18]OFW51123.1 MAG: hypothetical protein A3G77_15985 [Acidobacteria bacterium RIFCSPLOWO2_12_FULL_68_19]
MWTSSSKSNSVVLGVAAAAPLAVALFSLLLGLGVPPVAEWFWPTPTTNIAEAAAMDDAARVRWLAAQGAPLDVPLPVRDDVRASAVPRSMTPLEAAIRHRAEYVPGLLLELGLRPSTDEARRLYCLATAIEATRAATLLQERFDIPTGSCTLASTGPGASR